LSDQIRRDNTWVENSLIRRSRSQRSLICGTSYLRPCGFTYRKQIRHGDSWGELRVFLKGQAQSAPPIFCYLLHMPTRYMTNRKQISDGDQTRWKENFYRVDHAAGADQQLLRHECWRAICLPQLTFLFLFSSGPFLYAMALAEEELTKHMTSLRTQYARCVKTDSTLAKTHRQRWLVRNLSFLKPYIKKRRHHSSNNFNAAVFLPPPRRLCFR